MNPLKSTATRKRAILLLLCTLGVALGGSGCVYRPNIQQGNLLKTTDIDQVATGMTRSQVRYILGTPMISDPFNPQRWDYVYSFTRGHQRKPDKAHFVVIFEGDKVSKIERLALPALIPAPPADENAKLDPNREPPAPPSIKQPQPDSRRPGGSNQ